MNIVLIAGGFSSEREISLSSGRGILNALRENGHNVKVIDPVYGNENIPEEKIFSDIIKDKYPSKRKIRKLFIEAQRNFLGCINSSVFDNIDIVFIGLHGKFGEDGMIQALLEFRGLKYTGSNVFASALTMDKDSTKILFKHCGIGTPDWLSITKKEYRRNSGLEDIILKKTGFPCVVKPNDEGSTVGLTILKQRDSVKKLKQAVKHAFDYSGKIIVEKYIKGRELTVPVVGDEAYPVIEIKPRDGFYDFSHKYKKGKTDYICPAEIDRKTERMIKEIALKAYFRTGCSVYSRVDFILGNDRKLYCLEINTLPGMTPTSLVPKSAKVLNISYNELTEKILRLSMKKYIR